MKAILTIKNGNKDEKNFCRQVSLTPNEYDYLKEIERKISSETGQEYMSINVYQI